MPKLADYRLDTIFNAPGIVTHTTYRSNSLTGVRRQAVHTTWTTTKKIGDGAFGEVLLQEADGCQPRAVKKLLKGKIGIDLELKVMSKVANHQKLFVVLDGWYENDDCYFISMEYAPYGDLGGYITSSSPVRRAENAREITRQIVEGLEVLHRMKICHRDLKPENILVISEDPVWVKISDFGASKRFKDTALRTRVGSTAYMAPELLGMLPTHLNTEGHTTAMDLWSLGCVVHQVLTTEIPFMEEVAHWSIDSMATGSTAGNTIESMVVDEPQTDFGALLAFCSGTSEFPKDSLQRSEVDDVAVSFLMTLLVPDPKGRVLAKDALKSNWLLQEGDSCGFAVGTDPEPSTAMSTANHIIINHRNPPDEIPDSTHLAFDRQTNSSMPNSIRPSSELARIIEPIATPVEADTTPEPMAPLAMSGTTSELRPLSGILKLFRSWIRGSGMSKHEWEVRGALRLSTGYIYMLVTRGSDADLEMMVNAGMLILRDAVANKYPKGLSLITRSWAKAILKVCRNGRSSLLENVLGLCVQDVKVLRREGRIADAKNLVVAGFELLVQVCRIGDQHLIELVARVWARAVDDSMVNAFGDQIVEIATAFSEKWVTAAEERNTVEFRALAKAAVELLLAAGRSPFTNLTMQLAAILLSRVEKVLDRRDPIMQGWVIKKLIGWPSCDVTIGSKDQEWAQLAVAVGMEFFLVNAQLPRGKKYHALQEKLLRSSKTVLEEIVLAGHLEGTKTAIETLANKKFGEIGDVASDCEVRRGELQTNMREILIAVSNAGNNISQLQATIDDIMFSISS